MIFETVVVGQLGVNCFILGDAETKVGVIVDPGADPEKVLAVVKAKGLKITHVINTHGHFDHVGGNRAVVAATGAKLLIHREDEPFYGQVGQTANQYGIKAENSPPPTDYLDDGTVITFGRYQIRAIHTPGHTKGGCCLYLPDVGKLISGDTLFADSVGRTDFPGGSQAQLEASIRNKLFILPDETAVYPGHGPATTISHEKKHNPYVGQR
jgi:glyoxylase-like metal-dependent hydrolase (beta-lactamase superfamily II)